MTSNNAPQREPGYRGSLPPREDRLARPWIFAVIGIFVLIFVLSFLAIPSRFIPEPTPMPVPSVPAPSASASASVSSSPSAAPPASADASISASPAASASP